MLCPLFKAAQTKEKQKLILGLNLVNCLGLQKESGGLREPLIILEPPSPLGSPGTYQPIHLSAEEIKKCREACTTQKKSVVQMQPRVNPTQKEKNPRRILCGVSPR